MGVGWGGRGAFSSLDTFSSSSIGGPVIHPIADCEHPLLCLLGPSIVSQETATKKGEWVGRGVGGGWVWGTFGIALEI